MKLTPDGWNQAHDAGRRLRNMLRADDTLHFFTSPYRRTRETTEGILATLTSDDPEPSPFKRNNIKVYEEPRLREQDFGNFQPCSAEMERMWQERADYGHFFYRIPDGESAADAYDRVSGFNESLWRQFGEDDFASVCVLGMSKFCPCGRLTINYRMLILALKTVTHGLMSRVFLMKWYHFSVEYFEDLRNINHCEFLIMNKQESGKYVLENELRTWSALRRERALKKEKEKDKIGTGTPTNKDTNKLDKALAASQSPIVAPRRWGGCPNGCNHDKSFRIRSALADLVKRDGTSVHPNLSAVPSPVVVNPQSSPSAASGLSLSTHGIATPPTTNGTSTPSSSLGVRRQARRFISEDEEDYLSTDEAEHKSRTPHIDVTRAREEVVSSPDGTPSFISVDDRLRAQDMKSPPAHRSHARGRDFGGSYSGQNSRANSDADSSEDDRTRLHRRRLMAVAESGDVKPPGAATTSPTPLGIVTSMDKLVLGDETAKRDQSGMGRNTMANRLGDSPVSSSESGCCENGEHGVEHREEEHADDERDKNADREVDELSDLGDLDKAEAEDRSIKGSVY